jgi:hypothetical protein
MGHTTKTHRMIVEHKLYLIQFDQSPNQTVRLSQIIQQIQCFSYNLFRMSPIF